MKNTDFISHFNTGLSHFNSGQFWHAHESWEVLWLEAESDLVEFLQGLIQLAAAYHHIQRGTYRGAGRLFDAALGRLSGFPLVYCGIDRTAAEEAARRDRALLAAGTIPASWSYPALDLADPGSAPMPPSDDW